MSWADLQSICLLAQDGAAQDPSEGLRAFMPLATILLLFLAYIFMVQRPNSRREQQAREAMKQNLKRNDRLLTHAGIYGVVTNVQSDADRVTVRIDEKTGATMCISMSAIARVLGDEAAQEKETK